MTDKTKTIELKKRAHKDTILYLEERKCVLTFQLQKNRREIKYLVDAQRTFKKGIFHLINLIRLQEGKAPYTWSEKKRKVIRSKSKNKIISGYSVVAQRTNKFKVLTMVNSSEEANKFIYNVMAHEDMSGFILKAHKVKLILID